MGQHEAEMIAALRAVAAFFSRSQHWHSPEAVQVQKILAKIDKSATEIGK